MSWEMGSGVEEVGSRSYEIGSRVFITLARFFLHYPGAKIAACPAIMAHFKRAARRPHRVKESAKWLRMDCAFWAKCTFIWTIN